MGYFSAIYRNRSNWAKKERKKEKQRKEERGETEKRGKAKDEIKKEKNEKGSFYFCGCKWEVQFKIFLTKLKGLPNLFVTDKFLYSQYRNKEENSKGTENLFLYRRIFV